MEINENLERGILLAKKERFESALRLLEDDLRFTEHQLAMSYYALCLAMVERRFEQAISLCHMAIGSEFYTPEIYLNLGKIYLLNNQKRLALKAFHKGLLIDDTHAELLAEINSMGVRRRPCLPTLSRKNFINRVLGVLSTRCSLSSLQT